MANEQRLSHEEVRAIAELAKLGLSEAEVALYADQLSQILEYFTRLQAVDTSQVETRASVIPLTSVLREDQAQPTISPQQATANALDSEADQFKVNAVLRDE